MHVLSVIHYPTFGGPHNRNALLMPALRERGIDLTVVIPDEPGNALPRLVQSGVRVIPMPLRRLRRARDPRVHLQFVSDFRHDVSRLRSLIRAEDVDLVLINGLVNPHGAFAGRLEQVPVVWQLLDLFPPMPVRSALMPAVTRMADVIMSSGRAVGASHPGATSLGDRFVPFFPPVDTDLFHSTVASKQAARARLGIPLEAPVVGNVSNVNPMKGHDLFIKAAGELKRRRPATVFMILGSQSARHASYLSGLWRTAEAHGFALGVDLIVADPGRDVAKLASAMDVFWMTSPPNSEGLPTVVGEAMALSLPVVATNIASVSEAVVPGVTGALVTPQSPGALVAATIPYVDSSILRRKAGSAGRHRAKSLFDSGVCADRHEGAFRVATEYARLRPGAGVTGW